MSRCPSCEERQYTPDFERNYDFNPFEPAPGEYGVIKYPPQRTYSLLTPFSKSFGPQAVEGPTVLPPEGFRRYDLFALKTRLYPLLTRLREELGLRGLALRFNTIPLNGALRVVIQLVDGGVPIDKEQYQLDEETLQSEVDQVVSFLPSYCLLISSHTPLLLRHGKRIEVGWIRSILPFLTFPSSYQADVRKEGLYIHMSGKSDYVDEYSVLYLQTRKVLETLYQRGAIVLSPTLNRGLIQDWSLIPLPLQSPEAVAPLYSVSPSEVGQGGRGVTTHQEPTYEEQQMRKEAQVLVALETPEVREQRLYVPTWFDSRFAPDPVSFIQRLLMRVSTPEIRVPVGGNLVRRHQIASLLQKKGSHFEFHREYLYVPVQNLREATEVCDLIFEIPTGPGVVVATIPSYRAPSITALPTLERIQYQTTDYNLRPTVVSLYSHPPSTGVTEEQKLYSGEAPPLYST